MPSFYHFTRSVCPPGAGLIPACAYLSREDGNRGAAGLLPDSSAARSQPASRVRRRLIEMEELRNASALPSLQVVRVTCLAARVGRDAAALALGGRVHSSQGACAAEPGWSASSSASSAPSACQTRGPWPSSPFDNYRRRTGRAVHLCLRVREHLSLVLLRCKNPLTLARVN